MKLLFTLVALLFVSNLFGQNTDNYYKAAGDYYDKKDFQSALNQINLALEQDTINSKFLLFKANTLDALEAYQESMDAYTLLIHYFPNNAIAYSQRGILLGKLRQPEQAIEDYDRALKLKTTDSIRLTLYVNRSSAKIAIRNFQGAYEDLMAAYRIDSNEIGTLNNLATVCDEVGKGKMTLVYLFKIIKIDSTFIGGYGNIGFKYQQMGSYELSNKYFRKVLELQPDEPIAYNNMAFNKYKLNDLDGALADVDKSIALYPANSYAYRNRALICFAQKKNDEACSDLTKALARGFTKMYGNEVEQLKAKKCQ